MRKVELVKKQSSFTARQFNGSLKDAISIHDWSGCEVYKEPEMDNYYLELSDTARGLACEKAFQSDWILYDGKKFFVCSDSTRIQFYDIIEEESL